METLLTNKHIYEHKILIARTAQIPPHTSKHSLLFLKTILQVSAPISMILCSKISILKDSHPNIYHIMNPITHLSQESLWCRKSTKWVSSQDRSTAYLINQGTCWREVWMKRECCSKKRMHKSKLKSHNLVITRSLLLGSCVLQQYFHTCECLATFLTFLHYSVLFADVVRHIHVISCTKLQHQAPESTKCCSTFSNIFYIIWKVDNKDLIKSLFSSFNTFWAWKNVNVFNIGRTSLNIVDSGTHVGYWMAQGPSRALSMRNFPTMKLSCSFKANPHVMISGNRKGGQGHWTWQQQIYLQVAAVPLASWVPSVSHCPWVSSSV